MKLDIGHAQRLGGKARAGVAGFAALDADRLRALKREFDGENALQAGQVQNAQILPGLSRQVGYDLHGAPEPEMGPRELRRGFHAVAKLYIVGRPRPVRFDKRAHVILYGHPASPKFRGAMLARIRRAGTTSRLIAGGVSA